MIRLHHCHQTRSMRSLWLLHELDVPFDLKTYPFDKSLRAADYLALNPTGRVPTLELDGQVICESGAIAQALCLARLRRGSLPLDTCWKAGFRRLTLVLGRLSIWRRILCGWMDLSGSRHGTRGLPRALRFKHHCRLRVRLDCMRKSSMRHGLRRMSHDEWGPVPKPPGYRKNQRKGAVCVTM